jgi:hypothetical protein
MGSLRNRLTGFIFLVLAILLGGGVYHLFDLRFRSGDIYPDYSSFRADPTGTKILYQALHEVPGISTDRLLKPLDDPDPSTSTVLYLGSSPYSLQDTADENLLTYAASGGRVVVAFRPGEVQKGWEKDRDDDASFGPDDLPNDSEDDNEDDEVTCRAIGLEKQLQITLHRFERTEFIELEKLGGEAEAVPNPTLEGMPPLPWHTALYFEQTNNQWQVLYRVHDHSVIVERSWGLGSIVLVGDSYLFSNEAMAKHRNTELLTRWVGQTPRVYFDEVHLGTTSQGSIMILMNRYRLQGVLISCLLVAGLFIWKSSTHFIPRHSARKTESKITYSVNSAQGFTNLLMRHIPQKELMKTLLAEWESTFSKNASMQHKTKQLKDEFKQAQRQDKPPHPVDLYNQLTKTLNERK